MEFLVSTCARVADDRWSSTRSGTRLGRRVMEFHKWLFRSSLRISLDPAIQVVWMWRSQRSGMIPKPPWLEIFVVLKNVSLMGFEGAIQEPGSDVTSLATRFVTHQKSSYWRRCYKKTVLINETDGVFTNSNLPIFLYSCWWISHIFSWLSIPTWSFLPTFFHSRYYRGAAAAVIVFDITSRESFDAAKSWVAELQNTDRRQQCTIWPSGIWGVFWVGLGWEFLWK